MRILQNINHNWKYVRDATDAAHAGTHEGEAISLPHTWNAIDGQDGGNDYYRGKCWYVKTLDVPVLSAGEQIFIEFKGANSSAEVYVNNQSLARHDGGYSTFRVNITDALCEQNLLVVSVDNSPNCKVYPQKADFTFYGGIYRDVNLIVVQKNHFSLNYHGSTGLRVKTEIVENDAIVHIKSWVSGGDKVRYTIGSDRYDAEVVSGCAQAEIIIPSARLWHGLADPHLYTVTAELQENGKTVDIIKERFGCRTFGFDKDKGFILNGKPYPLRGVSRHQDYKGVGNAITKEMQDEDMALMLEMGANTIRLAHYQHDQYFYDLCDEKGMIVWAEIPYITEHLPEANDNTVSQLTELIVQNYNHPSIVCWGLSNEITAVGGDREEITEQHRILNDLAHKLDTTRPTVTANVFMLDINSKMLDIPDILSYNLYYGWYLGELKDNDDFFDTFRAKYPDKIMGFSEYGADANPKLHSPNPEKGDYTEDYQALYHEHMIQMIEARPYLWATHVWNMFDFAADGRDEGGEHGLNQKGLVSFDRKLRKDAFYVYKAFWSKEPFVHICGRRYIDRTEQITEVKVYSNLKSVSLYVDGELYGSQEGEKVFVFSIPLHSTHEIKACAGEAADSIQVVKVSEPNPAYILPQSAVINWFDKDEAKEGCLSIKDTLGEICSVPEGAKLIEKLMSAARAKRGDVAQGVTMNEAMQKAINATPLEKMLKQIGDSLDKEFVEGIVKSLYQIKKQGA